MFGQHFELNENTLHAVEEIGQHMPGGFFIYVRETGRLLYANHAVLQIFGCSTMEEFQELTGFTFQGMLYPDDYNTIRAALEHSYSSKGDNNEIVYRIVRKDGTVRWVEDYGHFTNTEAYGGICYVFLSDITEKREQMEKDLAVRMAVIEALSKSYHTVWLINDVETELFSLYRGDTSGKTIHSEPIKTALEQIRYSQAKVYYIQKTVAEEDQERLQRELELSNIVKELEKRAQYSVNYLRKMEDGTERYFRIEFARVNMPGGKMGIVCGFKDVDQDVREGQAVRKALEEGRRAEAEKQNLIRQIESAAKLADFMGSVASLITNMPAMSFSKDAETGVYLACNQSFAEYAHKDSPDGVLGLTDHEIFDPVTAAHFVEDDQKALSMDEPYIFFEDVPDAIGQPRSFQTTKMKFTDNNGRLCTLGMCVDVTEMSRIKAKEAENRVKQQELEQRLLLQEQLLEQQRQGDEQSQMITAMASDYRCVYYVVLDTDEGVCYRSDQTSDHFLSVGDKFSFRQAFTSYAEQYVAEDYRPGFLAFIDPEAIREKLKEQLLISYRYLVIRDGKETYEMLRMAGVRRPEDRDDHMVHAIGVGFTDIDQEMRETMARNRALSDALQAAEEANKAKTTFLSNMSHEIRTPMNAIIGLDKIALSDPDLPPRTREHLEKIGTSANHLLSIINDILDMSRIESGRMVIKHEEFSFSKLLEQVNTIISGQCRDKGLHYECRINGSLDDYYIGDDMKLRQIMINILGNAVKFTPEGGRVTFLIEEIARLDDKVTLRFFIQDTGIGMSPEFLPKLFDTFSQEDTSAPNRFGSTGLGMPITKSLVELMNGSIEVESQKGVGTTFTVAITLTEAEQEDAREEYNEIHPHDLCVLAIDDEPFACEHAQLVLGQMGIHCETAASGKEALEMVKMRHARREPYNLILVDWKMPEMDGLETTRRIREEVGYDTPIIILTSYDWDAIVEEARKAGVDSFVSKPLFAAAIMDEFRKAFKQKKATGIKRTADLRGRRILLAEDMAVNAEIMIMVLGMRDMETDHAENGRIAVEYFASHPEGYYDAILMDMRMPEMDGLEAARQIRSMDRKDAKTIPIIALTANAFDEDVQRSMQAGLNAHLSKPVEPETLYETLEGLIG